MKNKKAYGYLALVATSFFWGTTWVASKLGVMEMPAMQMAYIRQFLGGISLVGFFMLYKKFPLPTAKQFQWLIMMSVLMFVFANGLSTWSLHWISSGLSALIGALYPLCVAILERLFFKSKPLNKLAYIGLFLGLAGVGIVFYENAIVSTGNGIWMGVGLSLLAMLSWSLGTIFMVRNKAHINPYYGAGWQMLLSSIILFAWAESSLHTVPFSNISSKAWMVILYLVAIGSIVAFVAFIYSMKTLPAALASLYAYINPLVAMLLGSLLVNEELTIHILWGSVVTLTGVYLVNMSMRKTSKKIITEPEM